MNKLFRAFRSQTKHLKFIDFLDSLSEIEYNKLVEIKNENSNTIISEIDSVDTDWGSHDDHAVARESQIEKEE